MMQRTMILPLSFIMDANAYFDMLILSAALIIFGTTVCMTVNLTSKMLADFKTYAIHQISGGTTGDVCMMMAAETGILLLASNIAAFVLSVAFGSQVFTYNRASVF